jgi:hypothetical protein
MSATPITERVREEPFTVSGQLEFASGKQHKHNMGAVGAAQSRNARGLHL